MSGLTQDKLIPAAKPAGETDSETDSETDKPRLPGIHSRTSVDIQKQCWSSPIKCRLQPTSTTTTRIIHYYAFYRPNYFTTILITSSSNQSQANNVFCNSASTTRQDYYSCAWSATPEESREKKTKAITVWALFHYNCNMLTQPKLTTATADLHKHPTPCIAQKFYKTNDYTMEQQIPCLMLFYTWITTPWLHSHNHMMKQKDSDKIARQQNRRGITK